MRPVRSIAIINPLSDYGINAYSFELAEGLVANGVHVDFYTGEGSPLGELPPTKHHDCFPVLGSLLFKRRIRPARSENGARFNPSVKWNSEQPKEKLHSLKAIREILRQQLLVLELAIYLKRKKYDLIWTQWPEIYGVGFWRLCKILGMQIVHTVHNILPHEESPDGIRLLRKVYGYSDILVVHSNYGKNELVRLFPECRGRVVVSPHGMYTVYPRTSGARERVRSNLHISDKQTACLVCGGIRPYKNVESTIAALADPRCSNAVLIVAGRESGFSDPSCLDPLARTRRIVREAGILERVRLMPGFLSAVGLAELFEAADILLLPYRKSYGSGLLLLGMTFGKQIVATNSGGAEEYLGKYPFGTLLDGPEPADIVAGLSKAMQDPPRPGDVISEKLPEFQWAAIARNLLTEITSRL
jgi:glycosyltransferase involved in cell wall biosynthesis